MFPPGKRRYASHGIDRLALFSNGPAVSNMRQETGGAAIPGFKQSLQRWVREATFGGCLLKAIVGPFEEPLSGSIVPLRIL